MRFRKSAHQDVSLAPVGRQISLPMEPVPVDPHDKERIGEQIVGQLILLHVRVL